MRDWFPVVFVGGLALGFVSILFYELKTTVQTKDELAFKMTQYNITMDKIYCINGDKDFKLQVYEPALRCIRGYTSAGKYRCVKIEQLKECKG
jgi:hypothetical protein